MSFGWQNKKRSVTQILQGLLNTQCEHIAAVSWAAVSWAAVRYSNAYLV